MELFRRLFLVPCLWIAGSVLAGCGPESDSSVTPTRGTTAVLPAVPAGAAPDPRVELEAQGRYVYDRNCQVCHGRWGDGRGEMAVGMLPRPTNLTRARFKFRSTPSGFLPTDEDLHRVITLGVAGSSMPTFAHLSEGEVTSVIAYLKTFSRRWDDPGQRGKPVALPPLPSGWGNAEERAAHVRHGEDLFTANCAACHGSVGRGDGPAAAELEDEAGRPAPPSDLTTGLWKSGRFPEDLFRTLTTGFDGMPMPSFGETLSVGDRWDLVSFLLTLPKLRESHDK